MRILFICAGDADGRPKIVVRNQAISLQKCGVEVEYYCINRKGLIGYLQAIPGLRKRLREIKPDIVHAHYSYSGFLAVLAGARPLVLSLMGSDAVKKGFMRFVTRKVSESFCNLTIVKSADMMKVLELPDSIVIPNGVDTGQFKSVDRIESCRISGLDPAMFNILFVGDITRKEKNYPLAEKSVQLCTNQYIRLVVINNIPNTELVWYYNSADLLLLTSVWEGSPNVVKEAMACNLPVVSTKVGDVDRLLEGIHNSYVCAKEPEAISSCINEVIKNNCKSTGRDRIFKLGLDSGSVAEMLIREYNKIINRN